MTTTQKVDINGTFLDGEIVEMEVENEDKFFENKRTNK
jgi:hypothetical protein